MARSLSSSGIWLAVWERNPQAISFYKKNGFKAVGQQEFHVAAELHCDIVMWAPVEAL